MPNARVTVHFSRKIGLPNYSSLDMGGSLERDLAEGEDVNTAFVSAMRWLVGKVNTEIAEYFKQKSQQQQEDSANEPEYQS